MDDVAIFILYVSDQAASRDFYAQILYAGPVLDVPGMTEFRLSGDVVLGLMPNSSVVRILDGKIPDPKDAGKNPRCELYLYTDNPDESLERLAQAGGTVVSKAAERSWGDIVSYGLDPDGHVVAFAKKAESG